MVGLPFPTHYAPFPRLEVCNSTKDYIISGTGKSIRTSNFASIVHTQGPSVQKPIRNFREQGAWAYPGTAHIFEYMAGTVPPIISGMGKAIYGLQIWPVHSQSRSIRTKAH